MVHQRDVLRKIWNKDYHILAHDVGTGKTKVMCDLIRFCISKPDSVPTSKNILIICPKSVMQNWKNELEKHTRIGRHAIVINGTPTLKTKQLGTIDKQIFIINYDALGSVMKVLDKMNFEMIVFDELHLLKSHKSDRSKYCQKLSGNANRRFGLTGTMILNNLMDVFAQALVIDHGLTFGTNFFEFRARYFTDKNKHWAGKPNYFPKWEVKHGAEALVQKKLETLVDRRTKDECLDLPDVVFERRYCDLMPEQHKRYEEIRKELITIIHDQGVSVAKTALTRDLRLNQVTSGHLTMDNGEVYSFDDNAKLSLLKSILFDELSDRKVIIWAVFRQDISDIKKLIDQVNEKIIALNNQKHDLETGHVRPLIEYACIFGDTSQEDRQNEIDKFQNQPGCRIFIGNPASAGTGITLTASDVAVFYSYNYNLGNYLQALGRNHRKGSEIHKSITYIHLVAKGTIDEAIVEGLERKEDLADRVMNNIRRID